MIEVMLPQTTFWPRYRWPIEVSSRGTVPQQAYRSTPDYHMLQYHEALGRTSCECIETTVIDESSYTPAMFVRMNSERLPKSLLVYGVMIGGKTKAGRPATRLQHRVMDSSSTFEMNATSWTQVAKYVSGRYRIVEEGTKT